MVASINGKHTGGQALQIELVVKTALEAVGLGGRYEVQ
jgi:hypothetical protein